MYDDASASHMGQKGLKERDSESFMLHPGTFSFSPWPCYACEEQPQALRKYVIQPLSGAGGSSGRRPGALQHSLSMPNPDIDWLLFGLGSLDLHCCCSGLGV